MKKQIVDGIGDAVIAVAKIVIGILTKKIRR